MNEIKELMTEVIKIELEELRDDELDLDEHRVTVDGICKLSNQILEIEKAEAQSKAESENIRLKEEDAKQSNRNQLRKDIITLGTAVGTGALIIWGTIKSLKFEEEGTVTTIIGRGFINKLLPKK